MRKARMCGMTLCALILLLLTAAGPAQQNKSAAKAPAFEVVSIKPSVEGAVGHGQSVTPTEFVVRDMPLWAVLGILYLKPGRWPEPAVRNAPSWVADERYSVVAKFDEATTAAWKDLSPEQRNEAAKPLIKSMLADRFHLKLHMEPAEMQGFAVVLSRHGAKDKNADMNAPVPPGSYPFQGGGSYLGTTLDGVPAVAYLHTTMASFIEEFSTAMNLALVDQTGMTGKYDLVLPRRQTVPSADGDTEGSQPLELYYDLSAVGLVLKPMKVPTTRLVIDHIEKPSAN